MNVDVAKMVAYKAIVCETKSTLLEKASEQEVLALDHYTIRQILASMPLQSDIDHYKLLKLSEPALDNRLKYLDIMYFPHLFPRGQYGEHHPRQVKLSFSEYIKSQLLNVDNRFRKVQTMYFIISGKKIKRDIKWCLQPNKENM